MYLMSYTRPDIAFTVSSLSRFTSNRGENHWKAIVRVMRYLRYTWDYRFHDSREHAVLEGFPGASWISDIQDTKGTSGYVFTLGGGVMSWKSSKKMIITRSIMESEFVALEKSREEAEWLETSWRIFLTGQSLCLQYVYIVTIKKQLVEHKMYYIMVSRDICIVDTIQLDN
ncbi:secreted RxLR effector protein 161-like [Gossypium hirsutum]|uniref:Secreted RxLR effector protein 161-like n=1 Tax=Gossypium hirsutum TaxID=3635 RepID=A0ABM2ZXG0_GOSHI|nr:secreted RxLR effector protein 161-like [Gossypium hirsutum]